MLPPRRTATAGVIALSVALVGYGQSPPSPLAARLQLDLATVHAAALTTARSPADANDDLVLLITTRDEKGVSASYRLPEAGYFTLGLDQVTRPRSFLAREVEPGETLAIEVTVREGRGADAASIGSFKLVLTNAADALTWKSLECTSTCSVLTNPASRVVAPSGAPVGGVVELTGAGGTYHVNLQGSRRA
jgi:hypothetical protein